MRAKREPTSLRRVRDRPIARLVAALSCCAVFLASYRYVSASRANWLCLWRFWGRNGAATTRPPADPSLLAPEPWGRGPGARCVSMNRHRTSLCPLAGAWQPASGRRRAAQPTLAAVGAGVARPGPIRSSS